MRKIIFVLFLVPLCVAISCGEKKSQANEAEAKMAKSERNLAKVPDTWVENRVAKAKKKLQASEAGKIVWDAMEAHGGLSNWFANGPVSFHFDYRPLNDGEPRNTYQAIDTWRSRARHFSATDSTHQYGWDGENAWIKAKDSTVFDYNTRFWSLTPYFFMGQPFVLEGKGTNLELLNQVEYKNNLYNVVKVTFEAGTGDAPDDYYVLYFSMRSRKLEVIRYVVSYPGYFEKGKHTPEKLMELSGEQTIGGITFPKNYKTYWLKDKNTAGEYITDIELSEIKFLPELESFYFKVPEDAKIIEGL